MIALGSSVKGHKSPRQRKVIIEQAANTDSESSDVEDKENDADPVEEDEAASAEDIDADSVEEDEVASAEEKDTDSDEEDKAANDEKDADSVEENEATDDENNSAISEADSNDAGSENSASGDEKTNSKNNPGWADVMQKILKTNKPKRKKTIVLSKAKKLTEVKPKESVENAPFEIETEDGSRRKEPLIKSEKTQDAEEMPVKRRRKELQPGMRVKPSILDRERERMLQKIATKGVVQLFNVVKQQQTEIDKKLKEVGPLERKREQVMKSIDKRAFLDVLMGGSKSIPVDDPAVCKKVEKQEDNKADKVWSVLRDDFVMGAKLQDWDKKAPEEDDSTSSEEMDSD